jgi:endonuclease YncB( thermonuclease family)
MGAGTVSIPPPPPGFTLVDEPAPRRRRSSSANVPPPPPGFDVLPDDHPEAVPLLGKPTGAVHDGDTFALDSGQNARLYGVDAFELKQTGRTRAGAVMPLGVEARGALAPFAKPDATVTPTGALTYGRPVASLNRGGDAATDILRQGYGIATPEYLKADPERLGDYMEAERDARLNRRGAWAGSFEQPASYRHGTPDPWAKPVAGKEGESEAVFWDEALPAQGVRPEIADKYISIWQDPASTPADLMAFAKASGFTLDPSEVAKAYKGRETRGAGSEVTYRAPPRVLTDHKDGATGAALRGWMKPVPLWIRSSPATARTCGLPIAGSATCTPTTSIRTAPSSRSMMPSILMRGLVASSSAGLSLLARRSRA